MTDAIVEQLRRDARQRDWLGFNYEARRYTEAADEIERLLVAAGELAETLRDARRRHQCDCVDGYDERSGAAALAAWEKVQSGGDNS